MQCPKCGKTGFVTLSGKRFCSNCGAKLEANAMTSMSDVKTGGKTLDLRSAGPTTSKAAAAVTTSAGKPAGAFHGAQGAAGVLDLRSTPTPTSTPAPTEAPQPAAVSPVVSEVTPQPAPEPTSTPTETPAAEAPAIIKPKPAMVQPQPATVTPPAVSPVAAAPSQTHPLVSRYPTNPVVPQPANDLLPATVAAQVADLGSKAATAPEPAQPKSPALQQALEAAKQSTSTPSAIKIAAAIGAIAIMGGIVWLQNSPKLAFRNAAAQAGISASLPTYIPSSYHQNGPAAASPGVLTLNFSSPSSSQPLTIAQRASDWDSNALRENYVNTQSASPLAIQGQGLTVYMFGNQANWINHGVWYQINGTSKLGREDVLKIAYGL